jgi:hypothetical protein
MFFQRIFTEVTGGATIALVMLFLFTFIFLGSSFYLVKQFKPETSSSFLSLGIFLYLVISATLSDVFLGTLLFPQGEYFNFGFGGGLARFILSVVCGILTGFVVTRLIYFKWIYKSFFR